MSEPVVHPFDWKRLRRKTSFRPRARIIRLLGEELISSEIVAFAELIKNGHDSDATNVTIEFEGLTRERSVIKITDNGDGMDESEFKTEWLQFGGSWKRDKLFTRKGRPLLGQMGVGRFAADKIASRLYLISRSKGNSHELCAFLDWDKFDPHNKLLADLDVSWDLKKPELFPGKKHGTQLILEGLRHEWDEEQLKELKVSISSMINPFGNLGKFDIRLEIPEHPLISGKLNSFVFQDAHYSIQAYLDHDGIVTYQLDNGNQHSFIWRENGGVRTGPLTVRIYAWDLEKRHELRDPLSHEMRKLLKQWNGMLIFRDGFRVWPYGKDGDDWIGLDRRRVNNPTLHLGNNQLIGLINISSRHNPGLRDLTNREGMFETKALADLKALVTEAALPQIESYRRDIRKRRQVTLMQHELSHSENIRYENIMNSKKKLGDELIRIDKILSKKKREIKRLNTYRDMLKFRLSELSEFQND